MIVIIGTYWYNPVRSALGGIGLERKLNRFAKLYPWFAGLTGDLLFYIAIDTLFLTAVKVGTAATSLCFTLVLLEHTMLEVMGIMLGIGLIEVLLSVRLYRMITAAKETV